MEIDQVPLRFLVAIPASNFWKLLETVNEVAVEYLGLFSGSCLRFVIPLFKFFSSVLVISFQV